MSRRLIALTLAVMLVPAAAHAAGSFQTWGPHVGFSTDPSQVVLGGQLQMGNVAPEIDFVPGVDLGLGGGGTLVSINGDFHYRFTISGATWQPYAGGGVAVHIASGNTQAGGSLLFGADVPTQTGSRFFVEGKVALGDGPTFKVIAGWHLKMR